MVNKESNIMEYLEWIRVDSAGNITCLVTTKVHRSLYLEVAERLLSLSDQDFEQVGFIIDNTTMEMAGLEFCGNASRGFALWAARQRGLEGRHNIFVNVSGIEKAFNVFVDTQTGFTQASMPLPERIEILPEGTIAGCPQVLKVDLGGIMHFVVLDVCYSDHLFDVIKNYGMAHFSPSALGVMFVDSKTYNMVPVVYVRDVDTVYHEGSCGSGTVAALIALEEEGGLGRDIFRCDIIQPRGRISASLYKKDCKIVSITIEGPVDIGQVEKTVFDDIRGL